MFGPQTEYSETPEILPSGMRSVKCYVIVYGRPKLGCRYEHRPEDEAGGHKFASIAREQLMASLGTFT